MEVIYDHVDLFSGLGGFSLALERAGFTPVVQVENNDYCTKILEKHWPHVVKYADVRNCGRRSLPLRPAVLTAGFPCQPFSQAGKRGGSSDDRFLWPEVARIIQEIEPRYVLLENVPGILTIEHGAVYRGILEDLAALGLDAQWACIPASAVGAPHERNRWWCVAYASGARLEGRRHRTIGAEPTLSAIASNGSDMGDPTGAGLPQSRQSRLAQDGPQNGERLVIQPERSGDGSGYRPETLADAEGMDAPRSAQPRLRGIFDGIPDRLDRIRRESRWPARPGEAQYEWEAPRTAKSTRHRVARLKALGNAIVPQVAQTIAEAIYEALQSEDQ